VISDVYGVLICVIGVVGIGWILWVMRHGDRERHDEDAARAFFDEHGRWPDETAEEAERRMRAARADVDVTVSRPSRDGSV
jgi:hypothetical protein